MRLSPPTRLLIVLPLAGLAVAGLAHAQRERPDRADAARSDRRGVTAGQTVTREAAADAPRPPTELLKKTQLAQLKGNPAKDQIRELETQIYSMERDGSTVWRFLRDERGDQARDVPYVQRQAAELREKLAAVKAANPSWERIAEYEARVAHLERAAAAHRAHYESLAGAREAAAAQAEAAAEADWQAKRVAESEPANPQAGKVVFASTPLAAGGTGAFTSVAVEAPLFGRAYFTESGWNALHTAGVDCGAAPEKIQAFRYTVYFKVNGGATYELEEQKVDRAAFQGARSIELSRFGSLTAGGAWATFKDESTAPFRWLSAVASELKPGDNTVELEVQAWCYGARVGGAVVAKGALTVQATPAGLAALAKRGSFKMGDSVHPPGKLATIRGKLTKYFAAKELEIVDLRTVSEWAPVRNELTGVILHRAVQALVVVRKPGTAHCDLVSLVLEEPYDGRTYGPSLDIGGSMTRPFVCNLR